MLFSDEYFMKLALKEAQYAYEEDEVPVGAIMICNNRIIGKGYNQTERLKDVTAHAEMIAITAAANYLGSKFLEDCTLYVTLEPCLMCAKLIHHAGIAKVIVVDGGFSGPNGIDYLKGHQVEIQTVDGPKDPRVPA